MKNFKLEMISEMGGNIVIYTAAEGKEQAIEKELEKLFLRDWRQHDSIIKVVAIEMIS